MEDSQESKPNAIDQQSSPESQGNANKGSSSNADQVNEHDSEASTNLKVEAKNKAKATKNSNTLNNHQKKGSSNSSESSNEETSEVPDLYFCKFCPNRFSNRHALGGHQNAHRHEKLILNHLKGMPDGKVRPSNVPIFPKPYPFLSTTDALPMSSPRDFSHSFPHLTSILRGLDVGNPHFQSGSYSNAPPRPSLWASPSTSINNPSTIKSPSLGISQDPLCDLTTIVRGSPSSPSQRASHHLAANLSNILRESSINSPSPAVSQACLNNLSNTHRRPSINSPLVSISQAFANFTNALGPSIVRPSLRVTLARPANVANAPRGPPIGSPHHPFFGLTNAVNRPPLWDPNHQFANSIHDPNKLRLGVRRESMIHKPSQFSIGSSSSSGKQPMASDGHQGHHGTSLNKFQRGSMLIDASSSSSHRAVGFGGYGEGGGTFASSSQLRGQQSIREQDFPGVRPKQNEIVAGSVGIDPSLLQGEAGNSRSNDEEEDESDEDVNLDLKL